MNRDLILQVSKFILGNPEMHNQGHYFQGEAIDISGSEILDGNFKCASTGCVAGWGALIAGYHQCAEFNYRNYYWHGTENVVDETGREWRMHDAAAEAFGLNKTQAATLFDGGLIVEELKWIFDAIEEADDPDNLNFRKVIEHGELQRLNS